MIRCKNLSHSYGTLQALNGINLSIAKGELFGIIGPDGSGKTTLFRILASLIEPREGEVSVMDYDPGKDYREIRKRIGYMPGRFSLYHDLTVEENLGFYASVFGTKIEDNYHLIRDIYEQLAPFKKRRAGKLSGGMKQKLALSCALIHQPDLLLLDEPTTGVDAVSRIEFWDVLHRLKESGMTLLVSTPYMDEATRCDRIGLMQKGEMLLISDPNKLSENYTGLLFEIRSSNRFGVLELLKRYPSGGSAYLFGQSIHFSSSEADQEGLKQYLEREGIKELEIREIMPGVEDCFIQQTADRNE